MSPAFTCFGFFFLPFASVFFSLSSKSCPGTCAHSPGPTLKLNGHVEPQSLHPENGGMTDEGTGSGKCLVHSDEPVTVVIITVIFTACNSWSPFGQASHAGRCFRRVVALLSTFAEREGEVGSFKLERDLYVIPCTFPTHC